MSSKLRTGIASAYLLSIYATLGIARPAVEQLRARGLLRCTVLLLAALAVPAALQWRWAAVSRLRMLLRALLLLLVLAAAVLLADTPEEQLHFLVYGLLGWLFAWSAEVMPAKTRAIVWLLPVLLVWLAGAADELIQAVLPNRCFDVRDILFNGLAGTAGISVFATGRRAAYPS